MKVPTFPLLLVAACLLCPSHSSAQQTTSFTYQGQLRDGGTNANGTYGLTFRLFDASSGGVQIGSSVAGSLTLANGLFSADLDFGPEAFDGKARWLDITVKQGDEPAETLSPRVRVLPAPYALYASVAGTVTNHAIMNMQLATNAVATTNIQQGAVANLNLAPNAVNATNIASGQVLKTINGLTDGVSLVAGTNVVMVTKGNSLTIAAMQPSFAIFESNSTIVVPANTPPGWRFEFELWGGGGGGGGGGGSGNAGANPGGGGGGGGGAGYGRHMLALNPGQIITMTVGLGGGGGISGLGYGVGTNGSNGGNGRPGGTTSVTAGTTTINATGGGGGAGGTGGGAFGNQNPGNNGAGGTSGDSSAAIGLRGYAGMTNGIGGSAGNGGQGGAQGSTYSGEVPGGGGAGTSSGNAGSGGSGRVIMRW